jgi:hypothetical protein
LALTRRGAELEREVMLVIDTIVKSKWVREVAGSSPAPYTKIQIYGINLFY